MGNLLSIIFTSGLIMLAMYLTYKWILASENTHSYNRSVILFIYIISPVIAITERYISVRYFASGGNNDVTATDLLELFLINSGQAAESSSANQQLWPKIAIVIWIAGIAFFLARTLIGSYQLSKIIRDGEIKPIGNNRLVVIDRKDIAPFSARHTIVINRNDYESAHELIIAHEMAHIGLKHWLDLVLARITCIICWFNPATWLLAEELKSVHEYQADMKVLQGGADGRQYQMLLIKKAVGKSFPAIANSLNHSKLKKRITMMLKSKPGKNRRMRVLALAPAAALALLVTNHPVIASGLSTVGQASLTPAATADGKGSEKSVNSNQTSPDVNDINEVVYIGRDDAGDNSEAPNQSMRIDGKSDSSVKYSVTIDGEKFEGDLNTIPSDKVVGIDVIKSDSGSVINITTKKPGDSSSNVAAAVQKMPQFPGGEKAMLQWLREHIQYPAEIKPADMPEKVRVIVKFVVDEDGRAINPEIMRGASAPFNREALKVIGEMPLWSPGTLNGKPTAVHYTLPVNFKKPSN